MENKLEVSSFFACPVFVMEKPEFLSVTRKVSKKFINKRKKEVDLNPNYPAYMTESINYDIEMLDFANFVAQVSWNILSSQGYDMENLTTYFTEMWVQEHHQHSTMERHIHGNNCVISGFYFLNVPDNAMRVVYHDPRDSKVISNLPEKNISDVTHASIMVNFQPQEGQLFFTNSWLPHSFTKNQSKKPVRFIHFNVAVAPSQATKTNCCPAEVV